MADTAMLMKKALRELQDLRGKLNTLERSRTEPITIVGIGCRFPGGADTPESYWKLLRDGVCTVGPIPEDRWDVSAFYDPDPAAPGKMYVREGGFLDRVDEFDPLLFGISPREAVWMDPQQRLFLEVCWEALERAGYAPDSLTGIKTGVFAGISSFNYATHILSSFDVAELDPFFGTGNALSVVAGRLSYTLGLNGPALAVDTACSSSLVALHLACESLRRGECDMAVAGGVGLILTPETTIGFCKAGMLARDGRCKTFDASADGYVRGEGAGVIVLKRLADAKASRDKVIACIRGSACNHDGRSTGLTVPNGPAQRAVIEAALANGAVEPGRMAFVEAHGTGTSLGDPIELVALGAVFAGRSESDAPLLLGSAKTNLGHLEAAAGIAGVIKVALSMQHGEIPPHLHLSQPTPLFDWDAHRLRIAAHLTPWPETLPFAGVSSFGFSGSNAHVVMERASETASDTVSTERPLHIFTFSARTGEALEELKQRHLGALDTTTNLPDRCFTTNAGRAQFGHRAAVVAASAEELGSLLISGNFQRGASDTEPRVAFLFTGQGSQYVGMGRELYDTQPGFRRTLDRCNEILRGELPVSLLDVLYGSGTKLHETAYTQPALFALEYALAKLWMSWGVTPTAVIGHSLGEYVAACIAGVFDLEAGLKLAALRGRMMDALPRDGEMIAVLAVRQTVESFVKRYSNDVSFASFNSPNNVVISGQREAIQRISAELSSSNLPFRSLQVSHAFHSLLMEPILSGFEAAAARIPMSAPMLTVISNVTGKPLPIDMPPSPDYWCSHIRQPVRFEEGVRSIQSENIDTFIEIGPSPILLGMARQCLPDSSASFLPSLRAGHSDWKTILSSLAQIYIQGAQVDWLGFDRDYKRNRVELPTYPFQRQRYWVGSDLRKRSNGRDATEECVYRVEWSPIQPLASRANTVAWRIEGADDRLRRDLHARLDVPQAQTKGAIYLGTNDVSPVDHCSALLDVLKTIEEGPLWIVSDGTLASSPLRGMAKSIALEYPERWGGIIELDPEFSPHEQVDSVVRILCGAVGEDREVALRGGEFLVPRLQRMQLAPKVAGVVRDDATYLISGGLGGVGLQIAQRLAQDGARHIVLVGRSLPSDQALVVIDNLQQSGVRVRIEKADVAGLDEMSVVMSRIEESGVPLRGIIHAAGVLDDGILSGMSRQRFATVMRPKVVGAWVLHQLTEALPIDFFVMCSSAASVFGAPGQSNYSAANTYLDALAAYRRSRGLPAISINWGPWAATGMSARSSRGTSGVESLSPDLATKILSRCLQHPEGQLLVMRANWDTLARQFKRTPMILTDLLPSQKATSHRPSMQDRLQKLSSEQRREWLTGYVQEKVAEVLRLASADLVPLRQGFFDMGMDSLLAVELKNNLQSELGVELTATTTFENSSSMALAEFLDQTMGTAEHPAHDDEFDRLIEEELELLEGVLRA